MKAIFIFYGILIAGIILVVTVSKQHFIYATDRLDLYALVLVTIFLLAGIWMGKNLASAKENNTEGKKTEEVPLSILLEGLSKRESEILRLMSEGHSNQEIADTLFISLSTVKTHIYNIYPKLQVTRRTQAVEKYRLFREQLLLK